MTFPSEDRAKPSMWIVRLLSLGATMLLILNLASTSAAGQAPVPGQRVLMLYSDERLLPANIIMDEANPRGLRGRHQKPRRVLQ